jgi:hypothetical protein
VEPYFKSHRRRTGHALAMRWIANLWRNLTAKPKVEAQLDAGLRSYAEMLKAEKIDRGIAAQNQSAFGKSGGFS